MLRAGHACMAEFTSPLAIEYGREIGEKVGHKAWRQAQMYFGT